MRYPLRPEILTPVHTYALRAIVGALGCGLLGGVIALVASAKTPDVDVPPAPPVTTEILTPVPLPIAVSIEKPVPPPPSSEVNLVFTVAGAPYMKLADLDPEKKLPHHDNFKLYDRGEQDDYRTSIVGVVDEPYLPEAHKKWIGKSVIVDGTCESTISGFAIVARVTGEVGWAIGEDTAVGWQTNTVLQNGAPVLAAKLHNCNGTFARDAALAPIVMPVEVKDAALAKRAKFKLLGTTLATRDAQLEYTRDATGETEDWWKADGVDVQTKVFRHPITNVTWVSVHAQLGYGCGGPDINIWGLYRVEGDKLVAAQQRRLGELYSILMFLDLEGDGEFEMIGKPWINTDTIVTRESGEELTRLQMPFYGCAC